MLNQGSTVHMINDRPSPELIQKQAYKLIGIAIPMDHAREGGYIDTPPRNSISEATPSVKLQRLTHRQQFFLGDFLGNFRRPSKFAHQLTQAPSDAIVPLPCKSMPDRVRPFPGMTDSVEGYVAPRATLQDPEPSADSSSSSSQSSVGGFSPSASFGPSSGVFSSLAGAAGAPYQLSCCLSDNGHILLVNQV